MPYSKSTGFGPLQPAVVAVEQGPGMSFDEYPRRLQPRILPHDPSSDIDTDGDAMLRASRKSPRSGKQDGLHQKANKPPTSRLPPVE